MIESQALAILKGMPDQEFNTFLSSLPDRVQFLVRSNFVDWKDVLPKWYIKTLTDKCLHKGCEECHGTGTKEDGTQCVHMISCPCPDCSPTMY